MNYHQPKDIPVLTATVLSQAYSFLMSVNLILFVRDQSFIKGEPQDQAEKAISGLVENGGQISWIEPGFWPPVTDLGKLNCSRPEFPLPPKRVVLIPVPVPLSVVIKIFYKFTYILIFIFHININISFLYKRIILIILFTGQL